MAAAIVTVVGGIAVAGCTAEPLPAGPPPTVADATIRAALDGEWGWQQQPERLELGVTHTQYSLDPGDPDAARDRGAAVLSNGSAIWQNHHLMGFGTLSPEPSPGEYDWSSLDRRMQLTEETGGRTVLTLCCAPDWMKGGEAGDTDWDLLEDNPLPEHFDAFAALAAQAVQRYPQIERVLVWNELKGFYNQDENRWDYEGYTDLYNRVYTAVKGVRSDVQVGGPYVVLTSLDPGEPDSSDVSGPWGVADQRALDVVEYWLQNNIGADFLAVDGSTTTRQDTAPEQVDEGTQKFADLTRWLRRAQRPADLVGGVLPRPARQRGGRADEPGQHGRDARRRRRVRGVRHLGRPPVGPAGPQPRVRGTVDRQHRGGRRRADPAHVGVAVARAAARRRPGGDRPQRHAPAARVPRRRGPGAPRQPHRRAGHGGRGRRAHPGMGRVGELHAELSAPVGARTDEFRAWPRSSAEDIVAPGVRPAGRTPSWGGSTARSR